jgi:prolyl 4-hydroxylase
METISRLLVVGVVVFAVLIILVSVVVLFSRRKSRKNLVRAKTNPSRPNVLKVIDSPDRNYVVTPLRTGSDEGNVTRIDNFLSRDECAHLISLAESRFKRSTVQGKDGSGLKLSNDRTSSTANLRRHEDSIVRAIEERACKLVTEPIESLEHLQVVRYEPGQFYKSHYDYFPVEEASSQKALSRGGQRTVTIFVYLNTPEDPSNCVTRFPRLDLRVLPREGSAVAWHNLLPSGEENPKMLHGGDAPKTGTKYGLNVWFREGKFE